MIDRRVARMTELVDELMAQRAEERLGETVEVLVEAVTGDGLEGRAAHQAPEVDGATLVIDAPVDAQVGDLVRATVTGTAGVDLDRPLPGHRRRGRPPGGGRQDGVSAARRGRCVASRAGRSERAGSSRERRRADRRARRGPSEERAG